MDLFVIFFVVLGIKFDEFLFGILEIDFFEMSDCIGVVKVVFDVLEGNDMVNGLNNSDIIFGGDG